MTWDVFKILSLIAAVITTIASLFSYFHGDLLRAIYTMLISILIVVCIQLDKE